MVQYMKKGAVKTGNNRLPNGKFALGNLVNPTSEKVILLVEEKENTMKYPKEKEKIYLNPKSEFPNLHKY